MAQVMIVAGRCHIKPERSFVKWNCLTSFLSVSHVYNLAMVQSREALR